MSGLVEESLKNESSRAGGGDVDRGPIGGQAEQSVQLANQEDPAGVLVENSSDAPVDGVGPRRGRFVVGQGEVANDLAGGDDPGGVGCIEFGGVPEVRVAILA
ncbi:hypothetical protein [Kitasatospora sp. NPDC090308]|uniref:hypothetical protein n=1 Tax=Kitasatospora sp. NPDC090308 TaxID=3364082 RepID=UPI0037FA9139